MSKLNKIKKIRKNVDATTRYLNDTIDDIDVIQAEVQRVAKVMADTPEILAQLDEEFERKTSLKKKDVVFLMTATALQVVRQYAFENNYLKKDRPGDQEAAGKHDYDRSTRGKGYYKSSVEEIKLNPVPFDTSQNAKAFGVNMHGAWHRVKALGHEPILGWIFGTANIATRTITVVNDDKNEKNQIKSKINKYLVKSYHVQYGLPGHNNDAFSNKAKTKKVLYYGLVEPLRPEFIEKNGPVLGWAVIKEAEHLLSDVNSKMSLNIPGAEFIAGFAQTLSDYGIDMANVLTVGRQASLAISINTIVAMVHQLMYNEEKDGDIKLYEVRTRKILSYSNAIASLSNVVYVGIATYAGDEKAVEKLDIGGLLVTITRIFSDAKFIANVKEEFLKNEWQTIALGDKLEIPKRDISVYLEDE